eukprot:COSAG01_NODE_63471_length_281_cov_0.254144_1_plen_24_part_01
MMVKDVSVTLGAFVVLALRRLLRG